MTQEIPLPSGWNWTTLGKLGNYINGHAFKPSDWGTIGRPIIRIQNLTGSSDTLNRYSGIVENKYIIRDGDLLISWSATLGVYIYHGEEAVLNQHIFKVEPSVNKKFLFYLVMAYLDTLKRQVHGSGMQHITKGKFDDSPVPLPPYREQERIVERIETLFTQLDEGVAGLKHTQAVLKRYKTSVLTAACEGRLIGQKTKNFVYNKAEDSIPMEWRWETIDEISQGDRPATYGILKPGDYYPDGVPMLRIVDIKSGVVTMSKVHKVSRKLSDEFKRTILHGGECLISLVGTIGLSAYVPENLKGINVHRNLGVIAPSYVVDGKFLDICLKSEIVQSQIREFITGANQPLFNIGSLKQVRIPVPLLAEQHQIVNEVDRLLSVMQELEQTIKVNLKLASRLRQAILKCAFEGEL